MVLIVDVIASVSKLVEQTAFCCEISEAKEWVLTVAVSALALAVPADAPGRMGEEDVIIESATASRTAIIVSLMVVAMLFVEICGFIRNGRYMIRRRETDAAEVSLSGSKLASSSAFDDIVWDDIQKSVVMTPLYLDKLNKIAR